MSGPQPPFRIAVLDDDPTGIQTVHGCLLLTDWSADQVRAALRDGAGFFYILTNTRAMGREEARRVTAEAAEAVLKEAAELGERVLFVCRSDSTLRGHFPLEIDTVARLLQHRAPGTEPVRIFAPQFFEAGRLTLRDTQYMYDGQELIPTSESEFARDSRFFYSTSYLPAYIEEKSAGEVRRDRVTTLPEDLLEQASELELTRRIRAARPGSYLVVNAEGYGQLNRFAAALRGAVSSGTECIIQSSSSLPRALSGIEEQGLLDSSILRHGGPGLVIAGSHVQKTTRQLEALRTASTVECAEIDVQAVLTDAEREHRRIADFLHRCTQQGRTPVLYTSRKELQYSEEGENVRAGKRIADFLSATVRNLPFRPSFLIAKGGITSYEILVRGLEISRARVLGQVLPGVPTVSAPKGSPFAGLPYVIFPGNVGDNQALRTVYSRLAGPEA